MDEATSSPCNKSMQSPAAIEAEARKRQCEIPKNIADVLKDVKFTIAARRRENGFDFSGPNQHQGQLSAISGGSHYFNYHQNQQVQRILERYDDMHKGKVSIPHNIDRVVKSLSHIGRLSGSCRSDSRGIRDTIKSENERLLNTVVHLVMNESVIVDFTLPDKQRSSLKKCSSTGSAKQKVKQKDSLGTGSSLLSSGGSMHSYAVTKSSTEESEIAEPVVNNKVVLTNIEI